MKIIDSVEDVELKVYPGGDSFRVLVGRHESTRSSKHHTVAIVDLPEGVESDEHFHKEREESYFIITGIGSAVIDGKTFPVKKGSLVHTKPNEKHKFINEGKGKFKYLIITAPVWIPEDSHS